MSSDVIVVGAGLSGLVTAYRLQRAGLDVHVLEAAARPGGVIGSVRRNGVLYECGPNSGLDTTPAINALLDDLGIRAQRIDGSAASSRRYVVRGGRLLPLPTSAGAFLTTPLFTARAKLRLFAEPFIRRSPADAEESVAQFVRRRLGPEFLDYAIEPFVSGIYAGDAQQLSLPAAFPRLHALEQRYGSLLGGAIRGARERRRSTEKGKNAATSFSFRDGMQTLTDALAGALPGLECGARATGLAHEPDGSFRLEVETAGVRTIRRAGSVVLSVPSYAATELVRTMSPRASDALAAIPYAPVAVVISAYRRSEVAHPLDGFGFLAPAVEQPEVLGTLFSSTMFEHRADADTVLFTSFLGGRRDPAMVSAPDDVVLQSTRRELARLIAAQAEPIFSEVIRWPRAIPQYTLGHLQRIAAVEQAERDFPGLYFRANYRGGVSIGDCIRNGVATADSVAGRVAATAKATG
jgi:protoporphyrinogen/coproporphyrinogen III oxidase